MHWVGVGLPFLAVASACVVRTVCGAVGVNLAVDL